VNLDVEAWRTRFITVVSRVPFLLGSIIEVRVHVSLVIEPCSLVLVFLSLVALFAFYCSYSWEGSLGSLGCVPLFTREIACVLYFLANGFSPSRRLLPAGQVLASIWFLMLRYFQ
jgi:hypothetical protein